MSQIALQDLARYLLRKIRSVLVSEQEDHVNGENEVGSNLGSKAGIHCPLNERRSFTDETLVDTTLFVHYTLRVESSLTSCSCKTGIKFINNANDNDDKRFTSDLRKLGDSQYGTFDDITSLIDDQILQNPAADDDKKRHMSGIA